MEFEFSFSRYVKSRSDKQLRSKVDEDEIDACKPQDSANNTPIVPCGLVAWSLFNDTYSFSVKTMSLDVSKKDIAWKSDREHRFGSDVYPKNFQSSGLIGGAKLNESIPVTKLHLHSILVVMLYIHCCLPFLFEILKRYRFCM